MPTIRLACSRNAASLIDVSTVKQADSVTQISMAISKGRIPNLAELSVEGSIFTLRRWKRHFEEPCLK